MSINFPSGHLAAVCVTHEVLPDSGHVGSTGIDKRPVAGGVYLDRLGLEGDRQLDTEHHGGEDQAVYIYDRDEAARWSAELDTDIAPGGFGENLATVGVAVTDAQIGERWEIGSGDAPVLLEMTAPRIPCATFQRFMDEPRWVKRFTEQADVGAYARVIFPGRIASGDLITVVHRPEHGVSVREAFALSMGSLPPDDALRDRLRALLADQPVAAVAEAAERQLAR